MKSLIPSNCIMQGSALRQWQRECPWLSPPQLRRSGQHFQSLENRRCGCKPSLSLHSSLYNHSSRETHTSHTLHGIVSDIKWRLLNERHATCRGSVEGQHIFTELLVRHVIMSQALQILLIA